MNILITGGGGFQGSHLAEFLLEQGHAVSILNSHSSTAVSNLSQIADKINIIWGDVNDKEIIDGSVSGQDVIFHLAGYINVDQSLRDPLPFFKVNIFGACNVLEAVRKNKNRLIYVSSREVYGDGEGNKPINEFSELKPNSPYAASKAAADRICYAYFKSYDLDITIVRPFNVYGERQKSGPFGALIPILTAKALKGEDLTIFGDGSPTRDYSHVSDIVRGYNLILNNNSLTGKAINLANGQNVKITDIAEYIAGKFKVNVKYAASRPSEVKHILADISFARSLGFSPQVNIWEGIDRYIEWAKNNPNLA